MAENTLLRARRRHLFQAIAALAFALSASLVFVLPRTMAWARGRLITVVAQRLSSLLGRQVAFDSLDLSYSGAVVRGLRIVRAGREAIDPLRVARARVVLDWWRLITSRQARVDLVELDGASITLTPSDVQHSTAVHPWPSALLDVGRAGLRRVVLHKGSVRVLARDGASFDGSVEGLSGDLHIGGARFRVAIDARSLALGSEPALAQVHIECSGDVHGLRVTDARAQLAFGGAMRASGEFDPRGINGHARLGVSGVPLARLPLPSHTFLRGALDGEAELVLRESAPIQASGSVVIGPGAFVRGSASEAWESVHASFDWVQGRLHVRRARIEARGATIEGGFSLLAPLGGRLEAGRFEASGSIWLDGRALSHQVRVLGGTEALRVRARHVRARFEARGKTSDLSSVMVLMQVRADEVRAAGLPLTFAHVEGEVQVRAGRIEVRALRASAPGFVLRGEAATLGARRRDALAIDATIESNDLPALRRALPALGVLGPALELTPGARARARVRLVGSLRALACLTIEGDFDLSGLRVVVPSPPHGGGELVVPLRAIAGRFEYVPGERARSPRLAVRDLRVESPMGRIEAGSVDVTSDSWRAWLVGAGLDAQAARLFIPGTIRGGLATATVRLEGSVREPLRTASGHVEVAGSLFVPPEDLELTPGARVRVARFGADFRWDRGHTMLTHAVLHSDLGDGAGSIENFEGRTTVHAELSSNAVGRMTDMFPSLLGWIRGGRGKGLLNVTFERRGISGTLEAQASGGEVHLPATVSPAMRVHPVERARVSMVFATRGRIVLRSLQVRGPRANIDVHGGWTDLGPVAVDGRVWLTRAFSHEIARRSGFAWLAPLLGLGEISSEVSLRGTTARVMLDASIAHGARWRLIRFAVPVAVQRVLRSEAPLFAEEPLQ